MAAPREADPRVAQILALLRESFPSQREGAVAEPLEGDPLDQALAAVFALSEEVAAMRARFNEATLRLGELMETILALVSSDYTKEARVRGGDGGDSGDSGDRERDAFDGFAIGLNQLGRELSSFTVSRAYMNNIIESMTDLLVVTDSNVDITLVNRSVGDTLGCSTDDLVGKPLGSLFPLFADGVGADLIAAGGVRSVEMECLKPGGESVLLSFSAAVMSMTKDGLQGLVCVARDITEMRRAEEERFRLRDAVQRQAILVEELSTPLIAISRDVLVMPILGSLDEGRARRMTEALLRGIVVRRARVAILDITGMREVNSEAVDGLVRSVRAALLIGAEVLLTGISPEVARVIVELDADIAGVRTFGSLERGVRHAIRRARGLRIGR